MSQMFNWIMSEILIAPCVFLLWDQWQERQTPAEARAAEIYRTR